MISKLSEEVSDWVYTTLVSELLKVATNSPEAEMMRVAISKLFRREHPPEFTAVESSNLDGVAWHAMTLYVKFKGGNVYAYTGVTNSVYRRLLEAESTGKFLNARVKGHYDYEQLS